MKKLLIFFLIFFRLTSQSFSQGLYDNNWIFGDSTALSFSSGNPVAYNSSLKSMEAGASISDSLGNLLFYTNGINVWDKNHNQMPNGFDLYSVPEVVDYGSSATNGALILPYPSDTDRYVIFTVAQFGEDTGIHYSFVNMQLNNGNGDIELKNFHLLHDKLFEGAVAVKHSNGRDWWIITHKKNTDTFYWFLLNTSGISGPLVQNIGTNFNFGNSAQLGEMDVSKDGSKFLLITQRSIDVFRIDRCQGILTNYIPVIYTNTLFQSYGGSFSPNGHLFYVTAYHNKIYQFDLSNSVDSIFIKRKTIFNSPYNAIWYEEGQMQLGTNNKIYFTISRNTFPQTIFDTVNTVISCIKYPDSVGIACDVELGIVSLGTRRTFYGLPNMPNYNLGPLGNTTSSSICEGDVFNFNGNLLTTAGTYYDTLATVNGGCDSLVTLNLTVVIVNVVVQQSNDTLTATSTGTIQWFDCDSQQQISGAINNVFIPTVTGNYAAIVTEGICTDTSDCKQVVTAIDEMKFNNSPFQLFPNPASDKLTIQLNSPCTKCNLEITNTIGIKIISKEIISTNTLINIKPLPSGVYFVKLKTLNGETQVKKFVKH